MATWADVHAIATALPEVTADDSGNAGGGQLDWRVHGKSFAWERPLRPRDLAELGATAPAGPILGLHVADLEAKDALLHGRPDVFFATSHFNGYKAVLVQLDLIEADELTEVVTDAWLARAPKRLAAAYLAR